MQNQIQNQMMATLKKHWGYTSFLPLQEEVILSVLTGRDTLTMLATGGGKSLCFQLPALLQEGMAVVISPLISLMKDQVDSLKDMGIAAAVLNSSLPPEGQRFVVSRIQKKEVKLLYISPERLQKEGTIDIVSEGHTDSQGTDAYNQHLSERRAHSVREYLVKGGIDNNRIDVVGKGEAEPVASNDTADGRAQNRRVELRMR